MTSLHINSGKKEIHRYSEIPQGFAVDKLFLDNILMKFVGNSFLFKDFMWWFITGEILQDKYG